MPFPQELANAQIRRQRGISRKLIAEARRLWRGIDRRDMSRSWIVSLSRMLVLLTAAQLAAAQDAEAYVTAALRAQGIDPESSGRLRPDAFAGVASDGRSLDTLLYQPVVTSLTVIRDGGTQTQALASGYAALDMILRTQVADMGRAAISTSITARQHVGGYVRQVVGRTCGRCVVLAGRWYRWNIGFDRHPRCDCIHIPAREDTSGDMTTDPKLWFENLSRSEQDRQFTKAGAEAIREGADISRVVNARRGAYGLSKPGRYTAAEQRAQRLGLDRGRLTTQQFAGRDVFLTAEAVTTRGVNRTVRLMPESIFSLAETREEALHLLRVHGYLI